MRYHHQAHLFRRDSSSSSLASAALVALLLHSGIGNVRLLIGSYAYEVCGNGSSYCPSKNTCCRIHNEADHETFLDDLKNNDSNKTLLWGCIPSDMGARNATCCSDGIRHGSGCPAGYHCRKRQEKQGTDGDAISNSSYDCVRSPDAHSKDPLTKVLPRYRLYPAEDHPPRLYGINVANVHMPPIREASSNVNSTTNTARLAYYSNQGPITQSWVSERVLIVIHGANRNAYDYFCSAKSTLFLQDRYPPLSVMVIAPLFLESPLENQNDDTSSNYLYWAKQPNPNDDNRDDGTWRYGADATGPIPGISSFDAMDTLIHRLKDKRYFPNLRKIMVVGHSSGGQFVNRWSLLTDVWESKNNKDDGIKLHAVVANPSSYVYLTPLRFTVIGNRWKAVPYQDCPQYNQWEWGLDDGGPLDVPYRQRAFANTNTSDMIDRYLNHRSVVYLVGNLDRCSYGSSNNKYKKDDALQSPPCDSHGLETTCADQLQGSNRYERNLRYWASLGKVNSDTIHHQMIVPDVGHDHTMMFQSQEGIRAIYHSPQKRKRVDAGRSKIT